MAVTYIVADKFGPNDAVTHQDVTSGRCTWTPADQGPVSGASQGC